MKVFALLILLLFSVPLFLNLFLISVLSRRRLIHMTWILGTLALLLLAMRRPGLSFVALTPLAIAWWMRPRVLARADADKAVEADFRRLP